MNDSSLRATVAMMDRAFAGICPVSGCDKPTAGAQTQAHLDAMGYRGTKRCEEHVDSGLRLLMGGKGE